MKRIPSPPQRELWELYIQKEYGISEIADIYKVSLSVVCRWLKLNCIQTRKPGLSAQRSQKKWFASLNRHWGNWKGGITELSAQIKNLPTYSFWRIEIFRRDNFTCQKCHTRREQETPIIIQAHHLNPLSQIIKDFNILTIEDALSCHELWDIENGQTLCKECHKETDTYGYKNH